MNQYLIPICRVLVIPFLITGIFSCNSPEPISTNEALAFARHIEQAYNAHDENELDQLLDKDELAERIADNASSGFNPAERKNIKTSLREQKLGAKLFGDQIANYHFVKHYIKKKKHHLIFRLYAKEGLNYHDYELVKHKGKIAAADMYVYALGQNISEVVGNAARVLDDENNQHFEASDIAKMRRQIDAGDYEGASQTYNGIPAGIQKSKLGRLYQIRISLGLGDTAAYEMQTDNYIHKYPGNPDIYMLQLDVAIYTKNYPAFITATNNLDAFIDKDPFLDYYRGLGYKLMEKTDSSMIYFTRLHHAMPDMGEALLEMIMADLKLGKTTEAQQYIAEYRHNKDYDQKTLFAMAIVHPEYARYFL